MLSISRSFVLQCKLDLILNEIRINPDSDIVLIVHCNMPTRNVKLLGNQLFILDENSLKSFQCHRQNVKSLLLLELISQGKQFPLKVVDYEHGFLEQIL